MDHYHILPIAKNDMYKTVGAPRKRTTKTKELKKPHSRPGTPEQQPKKKQNTLQTVEPESSMSTNNNNDETPLMEVDPSPLDKGKGKEMLKNESETTLDITEKNKVK